MLELNELLHNIMHNVLIAIPAVDRGFLMLYDAETQKLTPKASVGLEPSIYDFKTSIGEGIGGKVYQDGIGRIFNTEQGLEAMSNVQENNMKSLMAAMGVTSHYQYNSNGCSCKNEQGKDWCDDCPSDYEKTKVD